jgi:hypothetical protein
LSKGPLGDSLPLAGKMHIFIDEAGAFIPPSAMGPSTYSLVLALIVPTASHTEVCYDFLRIRDGWPNNAIEVKGSSLDESQCAAVAQLLARYDCSVEAQIIDMGMHDVTCISDFKERQAEGITRNLTPQHQPSMVKELEGLANAFRGMSHQLFVQAFLTMRLVVDISEYAPLYYVQRYPAELGNFTWEIDRKDRDLTTMEKTWSTFILPVGEAESGKKPAKRFADCDYSHFAKYEVLESEADAGWVKKMAWLRTTYKLDVPVGTMRVIDWKKLVTEDRKFEDSKMSLGLQLADITATSLRRGLNGNLQRPGWEEFGRLLIKQPDLPFCMIGSTPRSTTLQGPGREVWEILAPLAKEMIAE